MKFALGLGGMLLVSTAALNTNAPREPFADATRGHAAGHAAQASQGAAAAGVATIRIGTPRSGAYDISTQPLESYVARVLAGEALPGSDDPAMEALAIAIRTYAVGNLGRHRGDGFDLCDSTHCQVTRVATPQTEKATQATSGQVLMFRGAPATVYYSASCGGRSEVPSAVWPGAEDVTYLPSKPDDGCGGDPVWRAEIALYDLRRSFQAAGYRGMLRDMRVLSRNASGRVATLALDGLTPSIVSGQDLRVVLGTTLGWQHIRSTMFELRRVRDAFRFDGHGFGHGVGMCVIGAAKLATRGRTATEILERYYPGTTIAAVPRLTSATPLSSSAPDSSSLASVSAAGIDLFLPDEDAAERETLLAMGGRARDELAKTLHAMPPPQLRIRAYRTTAEYEQASGRPWFTFGAYANGEIHLLPTRQLRDRGILESTLRRQIVHVLVDATLARRPAWVRIGAALFYGDVNLTAASASTSNLARESCPTDAELLRPLSPGALSTAYSQAYACFARQIAGGRTWRDVR
jgi:SpoIID/LytB domain protein